MKIAAMLKEVDQWDDIGQFCGLEHTVVAGDVVTTISEQREGDFGLKVYAISSTRFLTIQTEYDDADNPVGFVGTYVSSVAELKETIEGYKGMIT